jgi:ribonuclease P protein component
LPRAAKRVVISSTPKRGEAGPGPEIRGLQFPRDARLVRRGEFDAVYRSGKRRSSSHFTVFVRANQKPLSRFGFSIKKALGGAVVRNRIRRRLREIVRCHRQEIASGWDIVVHPKKSVETAEHLVLTKDFLRLMGNL